MRRLIAPAALVLAVILAGCSATSAPAPVAAETNEAACAAVSAWDDFTEFAQTSGRDDAEMVARRADMIDQWSDAAAEAPEWAAARLTEAASKMQEFADGASTSDKATGLYSAAEIRIEAIREQCTADGNL